jgi:hypothetical protein
MRNFWKIKLSLVFLMIVIPCSSILAQEDKNELLNIYDRETIYLYHDFAGNWFVKNAQILPLGRFGSNLREELTGSNYAVEEMDKARTYSKIGTSIDIIATTIAVTSTVLEIIDVKYSHKRGVYVSMVISSVVLGIVSKGFQQSSVAAMSRAVWLYNRDVLSGRIK